MSKYPKIAFIGAGSVVFMRNLIGDILLHEELSGAHISLMDIDKDRLSDAEVVAKGLISALDVNATFSLHTNQRESLEDADFVITAFQIGGYDPCTITDFEIPKKYGLRQTIADTLGVGGIMRGLRSVPPLWSVCEDMTAVCPDAVLLQYVNPMCINMGAIFEKFPHISAVGLCHSVQHTADDLAYDLGIPIEKIRYKVAGVNHMAFYLNFEEILPDRSYRDLYPQLLEGYESGNLPKLDTHRNLPHHKRCPNVVRYEAFKRLGYFVTESSEHFSEYVPWFIKDGREDLLERFSVPLDEYKVRCVEAIEQWKGQKKLAKEAESASVVDSNEYAAQIILSMWTGSPSVIYGNVPNTSLITSLPDSCVVEVPCLVDRNGIQPTHIGSLPAQLNALIQTNVNVHQLTINALMNEDKDAIYHAAMMDPHTAAELDLDQIHNLVDEMLAAHKDWLPEWLS